MKYNVKCMGINREFICAYIISSKLKNENLMLQETTKCNGKTFHVRNLSVIADIKAAFKSFRESNLTLSEFFGRTIVHATKKNESVESFKIKFPKNPRKPLVLFKISTTFYLEQNMLNVWCDKPIHMTLSDILLLYGIEQLFDINDYKNFEKEHQIRIHFYKLCSLKGKKDAIIGRRCSSVPGYGHSLWKPRFSINIG